MTILLWQDALNGRCFTLFVTRACSLRRREYVKLVFNLSAVYKKTMAINFHHPKDTFGIDEDNWAGVVEGVIIQAEVFCSC